MCAASFYAWSDWTYTVSLLSLLQTTVPERLLGRTVAALRMLSVGFELGGALLGGALGDRIGTWPTLLIGSVGQLLAGLWLARSALRRPLAGPGRP